MYSTRFAAWIIWTAYFALAVAVAVFSYLVQSKRMDIGSTMVSVLLLGVVGVVVTVALFSGSLIGTTALARNPEARRVGSIVTVIAGWAGASFSRGWHGISGRADAPAYRARSMKFTHPRRGKTAEQAVPVA